MSDRLSIALLLVSITLVLSLTEALSRIDNVIYDTAQQNIEQTPPADVVIVNIDEESLFQLGRWPWSRRRHAQLIDRLHADGARVIGLDIMLSEPQADDPQADRLLAAAVARAGNVVLPVVIEKTRNNGQLIETLPLPVLTAQVAALGRVHAELDADAIARSICLWEGLGQATWPHFAQAVLTVARQWPHGAPTQAPAAPAASSLALSAASAAASSPGGLANAGSMASLVKSTQRYIHFVTSKQQLPSLSYVQVLQGIYPPGTFKDKVVLVGAIASGMADSLPTPISAFQQPMPGVEFLANALISMRSQTLITRAPLWLSALLACVLAMLPMLWLPHTQARTGLLLNIGAAAFALGIIMVLPLGYQIWLPLSAGLLGMLSAYPLWAWRKLESAHRFLDAELARLQEELPPNDLAQTTPPAAPEPDIFLRRIEQVRAATAQLQHLEENRRETLAFVSHDIRVPLASAAAQIQQDLGEHHTAHRQVVRALAWVEDFLQTNRAHMLRPENFHELDVIALLHEVLDDMHPLAQARQMRLDASLPLEPIWVRGHQDTLSRTIANLLGNAIKFSEPGATIGLTAQRQDAHIRIDITDSGQGIAPQDFERLFKRFSRLERQTPDSLQRSGVGLGLYFVQTAVQQHGGTVQVSSRPGCTTFSVQLPALGTPHTRSP